MGTGGTRRVQNWLKGYLALTDNSEPPVLYRAWTAVSVIAAALRRKCFTLWDKPIYPNMYIVLVGPPGNRKGTAMGPGESMLHDLGIPLAAQSTTRESLIQQLKQANQTDTSLAGDVYMHASLTIFSKELIVFLGAKANNTQMISDLTDWYDCDDNWKYKTKTQGEDHVIGVFVNLIGATTPELIRTALPLEAGGGGLTSRIIFVYEDKKGKIVPFPFYTPEQQRLRDLLIEDLSEINLLSGSFELSTEYKQQYGAWYVEQEGNPPFNDYRFAGYFERRATHLRKLSMIMSASRDNDMILTLEDFRSAKLLLENTEKRMQLTFMGVGRNATGDMIVRVSQYLSQIKRPARFSELLQIFYRDMDKRTAQNVLESLQGMGMISIDYGNGMDPIIILNDHARGDIARLIQNCVAKGDCL